MTDTREIVMPAAWDAREPGWSDGRKAFRAGWLRDHGIPLDITYRTEFYPASPGSKGPYMRVYTYVLDAKGRKHLGPEHSLWHDHDHDACQPAVELPYVIQLDELPPAFLLGD